MQLCHKAWTVLPAFPGLRPVAGLMLLAAVMAIGGPWLLGCWATYRRLPEVDTRMMGEAGALPATSLQESPT
jgi:hypothetical protein